MSEPGTTSALPTKAMPGEGPVDLDDPVMALHEPDIPDTLKPLIDRLNDLSRRR